MFYLSYLILIKQLADVLIDNRFLCFAATLYKFVSCTQF